MRDFILFIDLNGITQCSHHFQVYKLGLSLSLSIYIYIYFFFFLFFLEKLKRGWMVVLVLFL